ncbi:Retrovirus-related Pol polyprotein from transposon opus, partial [Mucuna pruriens]
MYVEHFLRFIRGLHVYADTFDACLGNLARVLKQCMETDLVLNFEKCHFIVTEGIMLSHLVSSRGIEVGKAKIDIITSLPNLASMQEAFHQELQQDLLATVQTIAKDKEFVFNKEFIQAFEELKTRLTSTPILQAPNWELPFELMCDTSNSTLGVILGQ